MSRNTPFFVELAVDAWENKSRRGDEWCGWNRDIHMGMEGGVDVNRNRVVDVCLLEWNGMFFNDGIGCMEYLRW